MVEKEGGQSPVVRISGTPITHASWYPRAPSALAVGHGTRARLVGIF